MLTKKRIITFCHSRFQLLPWGWPTFALRTALLRITKSLIKLWIPWAFSKNDLRVFNVIYKKYIFSHSDFLCVFGLHLLFLAHSSPDPWNFLKDKRDESTFCHNFLVSPPQFLKSLQCHKDEMRVLSFKTSPFPSQLALC